MGNDMMTVSSASRMFRQIPVQKVRGGDIPVTSFSECFRSVSETGKNADRQTTMDLDEYRQNLYDRFQSMPYHSSNRLDTTMISISDAGIQRMMGDPEYETWVCGQVRALFSANDPFSGLCGGKFLIVRVGDKEEDFNVTMDRAGFPNGQDSMMPKVRKDEDDGFWIRREKQFENDMDLLEEMKEKEVAGIPFSASVMALELMMHKVND